MSWIREISRGPTCGSSQYLRSRQCSDRSSLRPRVGVVSACGVHEDRHDSSTLFQVNEPKGRRRTRERGRRACHRNCRGLRAASTEVRRRESAWGSCANDGGIQSPHPSPAKHFPTKSKKLPTKPEERRRDMTASRVVIILARSACVFARFECTCEGGRPFASARLSYKMRHHIRKTLRRNRA